MAFRTFGWIQDSQNIDSLYSLVSVFDHATPTHNDVVTNQISNLVVLQADQQRLLDALSTRPLRIKYSDLRGVRKEYKGVVQLVVAGQRVAATGQTKPPLSEWASDNFIRWAHALQFIDYDRASDTFGLTPLGAQYIATPAPGGINSVFEEETLSYPPAIRILRLLKQHDHLTKFEIGEQLGFVGESGFTHQPQDALVYELAQPANQARRSDILSDYEGTSDKYARGIAIWLIKLGWVKEVPKTVTHTFRGKTYTDTIPKAYEITYEGQQALKKADGYSRHPVRPKSVFWEMLAGGTDADKKFLRTRRGLLLETLQRGSRTAAQLVTELATKRVANIDVPTVEDDIKGLQNIGINIQKAASGAYTLKDPIQHLDIPHTPPPPSTAIQDAKTRVRARLLHVPHEYLVLIDLGFDGSSDRLYEVQTMKLLNDCGFSGGLRGGSNRPDGILWTQGQSKDYGLVVDTKAYGSGFSCPAGSRDEMGRYLRENINKPATHPNHWWRDFPSALAAPNDFRFLFVSGDLVRDFVGQIRRLSDDAIGSKGAGITSENLLLWAEAIMSKSLTLSDGYTRFGTLDKAVAP